MPTRFSPFDKASYAQYAASRPLLAIPRDQLAATALSPAQGLDGGRQYALAPGMAFAAVRAGEARRRAQRRHAGGAGDEGAVPRQVGAPAAEADEPQRSAELLPAARRARHRAGRPDRRPVSRHPTASPRSPASTRAATRSSSPGATRSNMPSARAARCRCWATATRSTARPRR
ncbi:hypothetical protein AB5I41_17575 [Sphingomonas sp. MMS24-JH45]